MSELVAVLQSVLPVFFIIGLGLLFRRLGLLTREADQSIFSVIITLLIPCLIIDSVLGNPALLGGNNSYVAPIFGLGFICLSFFIARAVSMVSGADTVVKRRTFGLTAGLQNWGFMTIPLVAALYDRETLGVLFAHNLGVEFGLWSVGILVLTGGSLKGGMIRAFNPPVVTIMVCMILNYTAVWDWIPDLVMDSAGMLGSCAIPMSLLLVGAVFWDYVREVEVKNDWQAACTGSLVRLLILPALMLFLASVLPLSRELKQVIIIQAAMPCGVLPVFLCKHYNGHAPTALLIVLATCIVGLVTIPIWIHLGTAWLLP
jgi:predicted permease